jgi:peptidyl-prolyl cis-trans isomerase D
MRSAAKYVWIFIIVAFVVVFLFAQTSGLTGRQAVTRGTTVASVNGQEINYDTWLRARQSQIEQAQQQQQGRPLTLDDEQRIEDETFNQMVTDILLQQEYDRRGITVTDDEIRQAARYVPYPPFVQSPEFQTEGRFDMQKYQRFLSSPAAKQQGVLLGLEQYYRSEIPRQKLFDQITFPVYVTNQQLWRSWRDAHDSAKVSYVALRPTAVPDSAVKVTDAEIQAYFDAHPTEFADRPGRAVVSVTTIPRTISAADSAAVRAHALELRKQIQGGASFADVAKRESADSGSAANGGFLGRVTRGQFVPSFDSAAFSLKPGVVSQPVLTTFGYHLIKVDERKGDTIAVRHILLPIHQSDSSATITDRKADRLASLAAGALQGAKFDSAVKTLDLPVGHVVATEGEPLTWNGRYVPSIGAWAFSGVRPGEVSDLIDGQDAYYLARLDSITPGGRATLAQVRDEIRRELVQQKKLAQLVPRAQKVSSAVADGKTLEQAAKAAGLTVQTTPTFTRTTPVPGLGQLNEAIGAAFGIPEDAVSKPISTDDGVYVLRVDRRVQADSAAWLKQKDMQHNALLQQLRRQRVQEFLVSLRKNADIVDKRDEIQQLVRGTTS